MLKLENITKSYTTGDFTQHALSGVSVEFRKSEFVAILGQSGSGKTTLLNIIGGLDRYDSGDLIINGASTKKYKAEDWDAYRNNSVGFIFQSYNLISHISVLDNIEMSMTLSGVPAKERRKRAEAVLEKVGLAEHAKKRPNQLSGGQMQRVAIARALVNDPDVILADEPTGALDSATSVQIMELIKEIAGDKLVIMVTHNSQLAEKYATRIISLTDGKITNDTNPINETQGASDYKLIKTSMSFLTALKLSFNNIRTKKGRTLLTAFASSIGIIGIALILSLSNGFDIQVNTFESTMMGSFPIMITPEAADIDEEDMAKFRAEANTTLKEYPTEPLVYPYNADENSISHKNIITREFVDYVENIDPSLVLGIMYTRIAAVNILFESDGRAAPAATSAMQAMSSMSAISGRVSNTVTFTCIPKKLDGAPEGMLEANYDILAGTFPQDKTDVVIVVSTNNRISTALAQALGYKGDEESIPFDELLGHEFKYIPNNVWYTAYTMPTADGESIRLFLPRTDYDAMYDDENAVTLKVCGIVRLKEDSVMTVLSPGIAYTSEFMEYVLADAAASEIVAVQEDADYNVLTSDKIDRSTEEGEGAYRNMMSYLGAIDIPYMINIFPVNFDNKDEILEYLDKYNAGRPDEEMILYTDLAESITTMSGSIMNAITYVLIAFSSISLVVSVIMIGIITYISVLERTKEIGILRSLGARARDISRVFNAETFIIGVCSGLIGVGIARLLVFPTNKIIENLTDLANVAKMNPLHALMLIVISVALTVIGGAIPAIAASKRDPVIALRTE